MSDSAAAPSEEPAVSVIVPVHGDEAALGTCIDALAAQDLDEPYEVVVVDNARPGDPPLAVPRHPLVVAARETTPGSYAARNRGLDIARAPLLAFTDADCVPDPGWLRAGVAALRADPEVAFVGGAVEVTLVHPDRPHPVELWEQRHAFPQERYIDAWGFAVTANLFAHRERFAEVGPFDGDLRSSGDKEWGQRAMSTGRRARYEPTAVVRHPARASWAELGLKIRRVRTGEVAFRRTRGLGAASFTRELARYLVPPVSTARRVRRDASFADGRQRAGYVAAEAFVRYRRFYETVRALLRGGRRA